MEAEERTHNGGKKVLVLGAGASTASDFSLPVMSGFFEQEGDEFKDLFRFLEWFYPRSNPKDYNLEEVLAFLNISRHRLGIWGLSPGMGERTRYQELYSEVLCYIRERLEIPGDAVCAVHTKLLSTLDWPDSVLTLNYDLVVDGVWHANALPDGNQRLGALDRLLREGSIFGGTQPPALTPGERTSGFYLKLHGSLDWLRCPTEGCRNHTSIFCCGTSGSSEGQEAGAPCRVCGAALQIMIVPPVTAKRLEDRGRLAFQWNLALRELRSAHVITFIGTSFAATDFELRWLVREGLRSESDRRREIEIVNPDPKHRKMILSIVPQDNYEVRQYDGLNEYLEERPR